MKKGKHPRASLANAKIHIVVAKCKCVQNFFDMVSACFYAVARGMPVSRYPQESIFYGKLCRIMRG